MNTEFSKEDLAANVEYALILDNKGRFEIKKQAKLTEKKIFKELRPLLHQLTTELLEGRPDEFKKWDDSWKETVTVALVKTDNEKLSLMTETPIPYVGVVRILFALSFKLRR